MARWEQLWLCMLLAPDPHAKAQQGDRPFVSPHTSSDSLFPLKFPVITVNWYPSIIVLKNTRKWRQRGKKMEMRTPTRWYSPRLLLGPLASYGTQWEQLLRLTTSWFSPASTYRILETADVLIARSRRCLTWHLGPGTMQTDFHMLSLPGALGPKHPHHVRMRLLWRCRRFNWKHLLPFPVFLAGFGLFVWAHVCVQTRLRVSQEVGHNA